uniref:DUF2961 domain-containing protein n=1 Tax=Paenibacillus sp. FSL R5-0713 TaxID=2921655 RepID=UPI00403FAD4C
MTTHLQPKGIGNMERFDLLPVLKDRVQVHYEGSIDKQGRNADWDWWLYKDKEEWVIFDYCGPGCIYNFVQHRYPESPEPTFSFYFDGEDTPQFVIKASEFGSKFPFVTPLADVYIGPEDNGRGPIRVVRSYVPMPFKKSCRITSDIQLKGAAKGDGGWGHVVYHSYDDSDQISTFTGKENYTPLIEIWSRVGEDPKPAVKCKSRYYEMLTVKAGEKRTILEEVGQGSISSISAAFNPHSFSSEDLQHLCIKASWDKHEQPDIWCSIGVFFGNELGFNPVGVLSHGRRGDGVFYNYFSMPYWEHAMIELVNKGNRDILLSELNIECTAERNAVYEKGQTGYFRTSTYYERQATEGSDSIIGQLKGRGHMVAGHVTGFTRKPGTISCEGDVRIHIDGNATPQVESDGSESWVCYGWGFPTPPECNPSSAYDGIPDNPWSMVRMCSGDWYPFQTELVFGIEAGEYNNQYLEHSGILFYYGVDEPGMVLTDEMDIGDPLSERNHDYKTEGSRGYYTLDSAYEGDQDDIIIRDRGHETDGYSEFTIRIREDNRGVRMRRRCDQITGRQRAFVHVDGVRVTERTWYTADRNPYKRWLDDEFVIPESYTRGKKELHIRVEFIQDGEARAWNEFRYWVYAMN